jgi:ankyrin repeat protein
MDNRLKQIFARLHGTTDFADTDFSNINVCNSDGDNALHCVVRWDDRAAAKALIEAGIDVSKAGDLGYTPLHLACMQGSLEMVKLLVTNGADLFALNEGVPPFTTAREAGQDQICDFLTPLMKQARSGDPKIWFRARIAQLQRELSRLQAELDKS